MELRWLGMCRRCRGCARAPGLISVLGRGEPSGDVMAYRVDPVGWVRPPDLSRPSTPVRGWRREASGSGPQNISGSRAGARTAAMSGGLFPGGVAQVPKDVVGSAGQLPCHRQGGSVRPLPGLDLEVVGMVGGGRASGDVGGLEERPPQRGRAL